MPETSARLPALTNVDRPSPRRGPSPGSPTPSAPDWQKNPARPRGGISGESEALRHLPGGVDDAQGVGPDEPQPVGAGQPDQLALPLAALLAGLGEPARDHDQPVDSLGGAVEHHLLHRSAGTATIATSTSPGMSLTVGYDGIPATASAAGFTT